MRGGGRRIRRVTLACVAGLIALAAASQGAAAQGAARATDAWRDSARVLARSGRLAAALALYELALRADASDRDAVLGRAQVLVWAEWSVAAAVADVASAATVRAGAYRATTLGTRARFAF